MATQYKIPPELERYETSSEATSTGKKYWLTVHRNSNAGRDVRSDALFVVWDASSSSAVRRPEVTDRQTEARFTELSEVWKRDCCFCSAIEDMALHSAYQGIIGMGDRALPFILRELQYEPDHWFWALNAITGDNPVPEEAQGDIVAMADAWVSWGQNRGYID